MARFSSTNEFSPTGTVIGPGTTFSNAIKTEAAKDARAFVNVAGIPGDASALDVFIETSPDNVDFAEVAAFNPITAISKKMKALKQEELSTYTRLKYVNNSGANDFTLGAKLEKKTGV